MKFLPWPFVLLALSATACAGTTRGGDSGAAGSGGAGRADGGGVSGDGSFTDADPRCARASEGSQPCPLLDLSCTVQTAGVTRTITCCANGWQAGPCQLK